MQEQGVASTVVVIARPFGGGVRAVAPRLAPQPRKPRFARQFPHSRSVTNRKVVAAGRPPALVVVASADAAVADEFAGHVRRLGAVVYSAHSWQGCLRVAASVGPDLLLVDAALLSQLEALLRSHPTSARAQVIRLPAGVSWRNDARHQQGAGEYSTASSAGSDRICNRS